MTSYFASDGSYGASESLVVLDTSNFTDEDWDVIEQASDSERSELALSIYRNLIEGSRSVN